MMEKIILEIQIVLLQNWLRNLSLQQEVFLPL